MPVVSTENPRISNLVKYEDDLAAMGLTRAEGVVNVASETTLSLGSVLGKVTASGKYVPRNPAATDGSEKAAAVLLYGPNSLGLFEDSKPTIPAATDTDVILLLPKEGSYSVVADEALVFDVSHTAAQRSTAITELAALGIHTKTQA